MLQRPTYSDERLDAFCAYCGAPPTTRDHVPPRVFLDKPYPDNLMPVGSCGPCNNLTSDDEEYAACLVECLIAGSTDLGGDSRAKVRQILDRKPALRERVKSDIEAPQGSDRHAAWSERMWRVFVKIARGHVRFENSEHEYGPPSRRFVKFWSAMSDEERESFLSPIDIDLWPEVGSRAMIAILEGVAEAGSYWNTVQERNYSYAVSFGVERTVRIVLRNQLVVEVVWAK